MRRAVQALLVLALAGPAAAQEAAPPQPPAPPAVTPPQRPALPVVVLRQEALFERSAFGQAAMARRDAANRALLAENREIEAELDAEERALTARRPDLPAEEFRALAEAFNVKVEGIRTTQDAKSDAIQRALEEDRARFLRAAVPVVAELMFELGAVAVLDQSVVILSVDVADITDLAVTRIDARIGAGDLSPEPEPEPEAPPEADPPASP